jgi:CheY-like chemotaxis protein
MIRKVLIADDEEGVRALVEATLANDGTIKMYTAEDGQQALDIARDVGPDVIFLDVMMPKLNGFEVCLALKSDPATRDIKVVMLTGLAQNPDGHMAVGEDQADDYLLKPFSPVELFRKFEDMVGATPLPRARRAQNPTG